MSKVLKYMKIILSSISLVGYLFISFYLLGGVMNSHHHGSHHNEPPCTYIIGQDVLCSMDIMNLIDKWMSFYLVYFSFQNILLLISFIFVAFIYASTYVPDIISRLLFYLKRRYKPPTLYEVLFSKGILNSKAY